MENGKIWHSEQIFFEECEGNGFLRSSPSGSCSDPCISQVQVNFPLGPKAKTGHKFWTTICYFMDSFVTF
ncbi:hypothetical protein SLA2020_060470 [Shorea laevis]